MPAHRSGCNGDAAVSLQVTQDEARDTVSATGGPGDEVVLYEYNVNLDEITRGTLQARLSAIVSIGGAPYAAGTATFNLRLGGAVPNTPGGTIRATITTASTVESKQTDLGVSFPNPGGGQTLLQITGYQSSAGGKAQIRALDGEIL